MQQRLQQHKQHGWGIDMKLLAIINQLTHIDDIDEVCLPIQVAIGQDDGGVAADFWTGHNEELWSEADAFERGKLLRKYIDIELMWALSDV